MNNYAYSYFTTHISLYFKTMPIQSQFLPPFPCILSPAFLLLNHTIQMQSTEYIIHSTDGRGAANTKYIILRHMHLKYVV